MLLVTLCGLTVPLAVDVVTCCRIKQYTCKCKGTLEWKKKKLTLDKSRKAVTTPNRCICETKNMARVKIS